MQELLLLTLIAFIFLFWLNQAAARDKVRQTARHVTLQKNLVFLDDSIMMRSIRVKTRLGKLAFFRTFSFEFSDTEAQRMHGMITCHGGIVTEIQYFHTDHIENVTLHS
ncbi:DUF3301 domain-containing protein [Marinicella sp. W31]|uniref:DUF3301 domain-containing protein n=1 Tax=Marinicella sp. W31 TaxID=3023713 RepID=UPI0037566C7B